MTTELNCDYKPENTGKTLDLGFQSREAALAAGVRARPVDLALAFGVTKQCVSSWIKGGRVVLGADGRVDPREALKSLLATGDPARLRAKFLAPLLGDLHAARQRIGALEAEMEVLKQDAEFNESSASEFVDLFEKLKSALELEWQDLRALPAEQGLSALLDWLDTALEFGADPGFAILDMAARGVEEEEGGDDR